MLRLYAIPWSTNVERVSLALAHKGIDVEVMTVDPADRSRVREVSGQELVPVIEHDGRVVADSPAILEYLEELQPSPPLFPPDAARLAEMRVFIDWFNRVWKGPPNEIAGALDDAGAAHPGALAEGVVDERRIEALGREMADALDLFESLLDGRDFLFGDQVSAADFVVFPFVKYAAIAPAPDDDETFHHVLSDYQPLGDGHPRLEAWIERVDAMPRTPGA
jgi:glutathione S-transferase